jgi:hypothetical protein
MRDDTLKASVQYGDYGGSAAGDHHDQRHLSDLAEKYGVDTEKYFVIGVDVHIGETRGDELAHTFVSLLAVDTGVVKAAAIDFIREYAVTNGKLPYVKISIDASLEEVLLHFKRFDVVLLNRQLEGVRVFEPQFD